MGNQSLLDVIKSGRLDERLVVLVLSVVPDCGLDIRSSSSSSSSSFLVLFDFKFVDKCGLSKYDEFIISSSVISEESLTVPLMSLFLFLLLPFVDGNELTIPGTSSFIGVVSVISVVAVVLAS